MSSWSASLALLLLSSSGNAPVQGAPPEPAVVGSWVPCGRSASLRADVAPGLPGSQPRELVNDASGRLLFTADDGVHGRELWASTGPGGPGTYLVRDIQPGVETSAPARLVPLGSTTYFVANDGVHGAELWKSDGTAEGTVLVKDIQEGPGGSAPAELTVMNAVLYFTADDAVRGRELWRSDGTAEGTFLLHELGEDRASGGLGQLTAWGRALAFVAVDSQGRPTLWRTNGQDSGLLPVFRASAGGGLSALTPVANRLYFLREADVGQTELYAADVLNSRTTFLRSFSGASPHDLTAFNGQLFFGAGGRARYVVGDELGDELWKSDGTSSGTRRVADLFPGAVGSSPGLFTVAAGQLFFSADDGVHGRELWKSDGTAEGTLLAVDLLPGAASGDPANLVSLQGHLFFTAREGEGLSRQGWTSGGATENTWMMDALAPDNGESEPGDFVRSGWDVFFTAHDWRYGRELWSMPFRPEGRCAPSVP